MDNTIVRRSPHNPILKCDDLKPTHEDLEIIGVFNPGACRFGDETILLVRVAEACIQETGWLKVPVMKFDDQSPHLTIKAWKNDEIDTSDPRKFMIEDRLYLTSISHLRIARSNDGTHFRFDSEPFMFAENPDEAFGVEDVRITQIEDVYYLTYTTVSGDGYGVGLASTTDFASVQRHGMIFPPPNKDVCIFPEKIKDHHVALHRPWTPPFGKPSIWYAESADLLHWGNHFCLLRPQNNRWEQQKIGAGPQPIKTPEGWLLLYHGCGKDSLYSLSLCLLDLENPRTILKRSTTPIMVPEDQWEKKGFFPNVVFSNGWTEYSDGLIRIYYGAADDSVCVAETTVDGLLGTLREWD